MYIVLGGKIVVYMAMKLEALRAVYLVYNDRHSQRFSNFPPQRKA
jgi:hypothetical protein